MERVYHCRHCTNRIPHPTENGIACKLTQQKPNFQNTCKVINFGKELKDTIVSSNLKIAQLNRQSTSAIIHLVAFALLGIAALVAGFYIREHIYELGWWTSIHWIAFGIGATLLGTAIKPFLSFKEDKKIANRKLTELEELLSLYNVNYRVDFSFGKKYHGKQEVEVNLSLNGANTIEKLEINDYVAKD